ncbi:MAG: hypothetical protein ACFFCW_23455 [Candidatus Hodarchaeota archaeon]
MAAAPKTHIAMKGGNPDVGISSMPGLCPNNGTADEKVRRSKIRKIANCAAVALRVAAQSPANRESRLGSCYRRM